MIRRSPLRLAPTAAALLPLAALLGAASCARQGAGGPPPRPPVPVQTALAVQMDTPVILTGFGNTAERASVDVVPQVSGVVTRRFFEDGAIVTNGQPLYEIDTRDYALRVQQAESQLAADTANLELARSTLKRSTELHDKKLLADEEFDALRTRVDAAAALVKADTAQLDQARLSLSRCTVTAPLAGICSKHFLDEGNLATAGLSRLTNIRSYDPINVEFSVSEEFLPLVRKALQAPPVRIDVVPRGETNRYTGTLEFLDNAVSPLTGTILLRGRIPNADLKLWARQFVEVHVCVGVARDSVMVPEGAIQYGKIGPYLYTVSTTNYTLTVTNAPAAGQAGASPVVCTTNIVADIASLRPVSTGVRYADQVQILGGVTPRERVVVLGQLMLHPGAEVRDLSQPPAAGPQGK